MRIAHTLALLCATLISVSRSQTAHLLRRDDSAPANNPEINQTICGQIINETNTDPSSVVFFASDAYECLRSVPFNPAVALRFIEYYNTTLQFQSTLAYLKDPPEGYRQPPINVATALERIRSAVVSGHYTSQLDFEVDVQRVVYSMHDMHVNLYAGILSVFSFGSPYYISSVSVDGKQAPQVYITDHLAWHRDHPDFEPSPIVTINGEETVTYLADFAALNSVGLLEPHADWNALMNQPTQDVLGGANIFSTSATFYPGHELNFTLANGTTIHVYWLAFYNNQECTGPLTTPGDFYNFFVLGLYPASYDDASCGSSPIEASSTTSGSTPQQTNTDPRSWSDESYRGYPTNADIVQGDLSTTGGGVVSGYYFRDISVAVLSIPTFYQSVDHVQNFSETVQSFIDGASAANLSRVVIDLQQNPGGAVFLALDTFRRFFPNVEPFAGSRRRSHPLANALGETITHWWESLDHNNQADSENYTTYSRNEWMIADRLNADTGKNFSTWSEYYGPWPFNNDTFSATERYNLSSYIFDHSAFVDVPYGYNDSEKIPSAGKWSPEDIVILTDGLCSSTCSLFVEMMKTQAGVRTVVMGGRPEPGPMQYASGSRGARAYSAALLDDDIRIANPMNDNSTDALPQVRDSGIYTLYAGFNLRDQIRENETVPLQFLYEPAHCRLYYTMDNIYNMSRLWRDTATATWHNSSMCVEGSTNASLSDFNLTVSAQSLLDALSVPMSDILPDDFDIAPLIGTVNLI
ncbi:hypothetical protein SLS58_005620 [Diplodia intermedia]|uniref:Tail specific protease domain-containing protein n=1 Tax=Diplodia intermedia TaxID=856260 RepID=A0ABR3TQ47_9PEZI